MRRILLTALFATSLLLITQTADAQDRNFGIGAAIGGPDGISYKAWISDPTAVAGVVAFGAGEGSSRFYTHLDYLIHRFYDDLDWEVGRLHYYYGGGVGFQWNDSPGSSDRFLLRIPVGLGFNFTDVPADIFFELAPQFDVSPSFDFHFNGNLGFRFYLN